MRLVPGGGSPTATLDFEFARLEFDIEVKRAFIFLEVALDLVHESEEITQQHQAALGYRLEDRFVSRMHNPHFVPQYWPVVIADVPPLGGPGS